MKTIRISIVGAPSRLTAIAAALLLVAQPAAAQDAEARANEVRRDLATPDSRVEVGVGFLSGEHRRFGEYTGLTENGGYGLVDLDLAQRDEASGTWRKLRGRKLGLDSRELRFEHERQGDWAYFLEFSQLPRNEPLVVNTGLQGSGSAGQTVSATAAKRDLDLKMDHDIYALGVRKLVAGGFEVRASFRQDEKRGERMYGRGQPGATPAAAVMEFLAEPIDRTTRQWDVVVGYADSQLQLAGGYSGSAFDNHAPRLDVAGGAAALATLTPLALPPSNEAHQLHLAGGYNFADSSRASFKLARTLATQNDVFAVPTPVRGSLDGRVVTTLAFADLTLRPAERLDLTASLRFEDRDDQTPIAQYLSGAAATGPNTTGTSAGVTGKNLPRSLKQLKGAVEAGYQIDSNYRLVASLEEEQIARNVPVQFRRIGYREKTDETLVRLELKRNLAETLNGGLAYVHSERGGSDYVADTYDNTSVTTNQINPLLWADRRRDKLRLTGDWLPDEQWSVQFIADLADDRYSGRALGPRKGKGSFVSGDLSYALGEKWNLSAWVSQERNRAEQVTESDRSSAPPVVEDRGVIWRARLRNVTTAWGLGLRGRPQAKLELGAALVSSTDTAEHGMARVGGSGTTNPASLPDYFYRQTSLKLFADYALERNSGVRGDFTYEHRRSNDWTWTDWTYSSASDGTTVVAPRLENTRFLGLSYYYRWR